MVLVAAGLTAGQTIVSAGVHTLTPGQKVTLYAAAPEPRPRHSAAVSRRPPQLTSPRGSTAVHGRGAPRRDPPTNHRRFNISRWALEHPALTRYLMVVLMVLGFAAYFQLGQDEDPPFTFRAMVVQAFWPGASAEQMAEQVTSKIERALQDVPYFDVLRSYSKPGESLTILQLKDSSPPKEVQRRLVPGTQEGRRHRGRRCRRA